MILENFKRIKDSKNGHFSYHLQNKEILYMLNLKSKWIYALGKNLKTRKFFSI